MTLSLYSTLGLALGLSFSAGLSRLHAQSATNVGNAFDSAAEVTQWEHWWGAPPWTIEFDPAVDAGGNPASGSMKITVQFDRATHGGDNQFSFLRNTGYTIDGTQYTNLVMDILVATNSPQRPWGDFGRFEYGIRQLDWGQSYFGYRDLPTNGGWIHLDAPVPLTDPEIEQIAGLHFKMWSGDASWGQSGLYTFWVDNITLIAKTNGQPIPPPTLSLQRSGPPGLHLAASQAGQQYQRQNVRTTSTYNSWRLNFDPVQYALTITNFPGGAYSGFQAHMFMVPGSASAGDSAPDWTQPNVIFFQIAGNADGSGNGRFMYKTNLPNGNSMFWNTDPGAGPVGTLAMQWSPSPLGTWSLTFNPDGTNTLTAPNGSVTNFTMPSDAEALFGNPLYVYFGIQPNNPGNIGQSATFSRVQISGDPNAVTNLNEDFTSGVLPSTLELSAADPPGVRVVPTNAVYWLSWTLPATGFSVLSSPNLAPGSWTDPGLTNIITISGRNTVLITDTNLPGPTGYWKLVKPTTSQ